MTTWKHLFLDGEFSPRERLLSGLTLEQVTRRPAGASHSIYEELWHATTWQRIVVERDEVGGEAWLGGGPDYPSEPPDREQAWQDLVTAFLAGAAKAVAWGQSAGDGDRPWGDDGGRAAQLGDPQRVPPGKDRGPPAADRCVAAEAGVMPAVRAGLTLTGAAQANGCTGRGAAEASVIIQFVAPRR